MIHSPGPKEDPRAAAWISVALLRWFRTAARPMAWRETRDPYRIWVSEIMLQQTRVETVAPYYERFLLKFPDVGSLARAPLDDVLKAWEGLGYYSRARNLHRAGGILVARHGAKVPRTVEALEALPGIGRSTAGAIAAIAFGADVPILDANARRVVARLFAVEGDPRSSAVENVLWKRSASLVRKGKGRDTALAVMDLGAVVCLPNAPRCRECPLGSRCSSYLRGLQDSIPPKRAKKVVPHHDVVAAVFRRRDGALFLMRRPSEGLLGGLWAFPSGRRDPGETLEDALRRSLREKLQVRAVIQREVGAVRHAYSHYRITLHGFLCKTSGGALPAGEGTGWLPGHGEGTFALPWADRKLVEFIRVETARGTGSKRSGLPERVKILVSACLLGEKVRYDGGDKRDLFLNETLGPFVEWVRVCPEVDCGLPVPREAMRLVGDPKHPLLVTNKTGIDLTERMERWAKARLEELSGLGLCGYICKKDSPSCGMVPVGVFTRMFIERFPHLPVEEEGRLTDPVLLETFLQRILRSPA